MKNRLIITISDVHGSKQYSVNDMIKKVILFAIPTFILIGVLTFMYIRFLNSQVSSFETKMIVLEESAIKIKKHNETLSVNNKELALRMQESSDKLSSINAQLHEVEELIGIGPDINGTFTNLSEQVRTHEENIKKQQSVDINQSIHHATKALVKTAKALVKTAKEDKISAIQKALLLNSIPNGKPLNYKRVSSKFGYRVHPVTKKRSFHAGMDLPARHGTPIYAPASGVVVYAKEKGAYGNYMLITHSYGFKTAYGHLSRYAVKSGDYVIKGQKIAYVGSTGRSTGPHLHYEIRYLTKWVDPKAFMAWDLDNINYITDKIKTVNWKSILKQTKKLISLSTK